MKPVQMPTSPGDPCWRVASVEAQLSPISQVGDERTDWFLATHSPVHCKTVAGDLLSEGQLFERLFHSAAAEQLVVIKGPPGAGKSQLINWLRLRFEDALAREEGRSQGTGRLRTVLIRRRSGSLKDALQQLVKQLPGYERFLDDVKTAIAEISSEQARRKLSFEISNSLFGLQQCGELPRDLQHLHQLFQDLRSSEWMCRAGGTIDRNIQRLTGGSDVQDRESLPLFTADDFNIGTRRGRDVDTLMLDLLEESNALRAQAADVVNKVLRESLANVTGIKGQTLHEIFRNIRQEMRKAGESLALFVEDVSTLSILDEELVNALEPQGDSELCRMLSVLGMTVPAFARLQENKKDRITLALEIQGDLGGVGPLADPDQTDRFVARYLNALRAGDEQLQELAEDRRRKDEVNHSACEGCSLRDKCFAAFGSVELGSVTVGLYPLASGAAFRMLEGLDALDASRNPRSLLQRILLPLLETVGAIRTPKGASLGIELKPVAPTDLGSLKDRLLGGWGAVEQGRLSYLTWYWAGAHNLREGSWRLRPMLPWLDMRDFSAEIPDAPTPISLGTEPQSIRTLPAESGAGFAATAAVAAPASAHATATSVSPSEPAIPPRLAKARQRLDAWFYNNKRLENDAEFRDLLVPVVRESLDDEGARDPSYAMRQLAGSLKSTHIYIEDMVANPRAGTKARFNFARNEDTYNLLQVLLDFSILGRNSWSFDGAASQQRVYARWLTRHRDAMLQAYHVVSCPPRDAQEVAACFLVMAYRFCKRKALPNDTADAVSLLTSFEPTEPTVVSDVARKLVADARDRIPKIRAFLFDELSVPQGDGGSVNFIDPRRLIEAIARHGSATRLPAFEYPTAQTDYMDIWRLSQSVWKDVYAALEAEHAALVGMLEEMRRIVQRWDVEVGEQVQDGDSLVGEVQVFLESAREAVKACSDAGHSIGEADLQSRIKELAPQKVTTWLAPLAPALEVEASGPEAVLSFDFTPLLRLSGFISDIDKAMRPLAAAMEARMGDGVTEADVEKERLRALGALQALLETMEPDAVHQIQENEHAGQA